MGAITGTEIEALCVQQLSDEDNIAWSSAELLLYLNDAQRAVCLERADAHTAIIDITLDAGTIQSITERRVLRFLGNSTGRRINVVEYDDLSRADEDMYATSDQQAEVEDVAYDERDAQRFYVSPPNDGNGSIKAIVSSNPDNLANLTEQIRLNDAYVPAIIEWVLYRAFSKDSEMTPNWGRAGRHFQNFYTMLGRKAPSDRAITPNQPSVRELQEGVR